MSQMGYNRNSPKEVVYGPEEMGGFGFHDLFIEQGIHQVTALVGHLHEIIISIYLLATIYKLKRAAASVLKKVPPG
jgi:hypothetical protein